MKIIDLFCGCGGMSLGFQNAGFEIVASIELWDEAIQCYSNNFLHPVKRIDLSDTENAVTVLLNYSPEVIIGGPPCQDFSGAGKREEGERANLTVAFANIIKEMKPRFFIMENVERATLSNAYKEAKETFLKSGYGLTEKVLDASFCGVPQKRKRFFCIGEMNGVHSFLDGLLSTNQSVFPLTVKEYFNEKQYLLNFENYYRHPRSYKRRGIFSVNEPSPTIRGVNRPKPENYNAHQGDSALPADIRSLTYTERALIQTFPPTYKWGSSSVASIEQMIGNAVPVNLAEYVANCLMKYINGETDLHNLRFIDWLKVNKDLSPAVAGDTLSRLGRAKKILPLDNSCDSYIKTLSNTQQFNNISPSVQAQMKRAIRLYFEYIADIKENSDE